MKRTTYITLFAIFGILLSTIIHGLIEVPVIYLLVSDFKKFGLGFTWKQWYDIHFIFTITLGLAGAIWGIVMGIKHWKLLYEGQNLLGNIPLLRRSRALKNKKLHK